MDNITSRIYPPASRSSAPAAAEDTTLAGNSTEIPEAFETIHLPLADSVGSSEGGTSARPDNVQTTTLDSAAVSKDPLSSSPLERLPNELLSSIFSYFDSSKPSEAFLLDEPAFDLTVAKFAPLKSFSQVSRRWRTLVIPVLFKHARFTVPDSRPGKEGLSKQIEPFYSFVEAQGLRDIIASFTFLVHDQKIFYISDKEDRLNSFSLFWNSLFQVIDPIDLLLVAHPAALGPLTACQVILEDAWSLDCPCHYLRLQRSPTPPSVARPYPNANSAEKFPTDRQTKSLVEPVTENFSVDNVPDLTERSAGNKHSPEPTTLATYSGSDLEPWELPRAETSAIFDIRPWTSLLLNEGSFVRAYATHEFWTKRLPSILSDIVGSAEELQKPFISPTIRNMAYIGIFPTEKHFSCFAENLPRLDKLYVQLVPRNDILDNPSKMTKVEPDDLWGERNSCYASLVRELFNSPPSDNYKYLQVFESGDAADRDAWLMAVEYVRRSNNGWKIASDGVFVRDPTDVDKENEETNDGEENTSLSVMI